MNKKEINFFEKHVEKMVFALVALLSFWLLVQNVVFTPVKVEYGGGKYAPAEIDEKVSAKAQILKEHISRKPLKKEPYSAKAPKLEKRFEAVLANISAKAVWPQPVNNLNNYLSDRQYPLPEIPSLAAVNAEHIRALAYLPVEEVSEENEYRDEISEQGDLDMVTVEAQFNIAQLLNNFYDNFAGENLKPEWRDPCLAKPVFGAVELQRRQLLENGKWSDWDFVSRPAIDACKTFFEVPELAEDLPPGGIKVYTLRFKNPQMAANLLQPEPYQIASAEEEWYPPQLHAKFLNYQAGLSEHDKRAARLESSAEKLKKREERTTTNKNRPRRERAPRVPAVQPAGMPGMGGGTGMGGPGMGAPGGVGIAPQPETTRNKRDRSAAKEKRDSEIQKKETALSEKAKKLAEQLKQLEEEYEQYKIGEDTDIASLETLTVWAFDDTVEPGQKYQYRMRVGVFNPLAGTGSVTEEFRDIKDQVLLWSDYSQETSQVEVPLRTYFFAWDYQEVAKTMAIKVAKYSMGYWNIADFRVNQGEDIGEFVSKPSQDNDEPLEIDYSTGNVFVDAVKSKDWGSPQKMQERVYHDMLYTSNGIEVNHTPVKRSNWPESLTSIYDLVSSASKAEKLPPRAWGESRERRGLDSYEGMPGMNPMMNPMMDPMMMQMMMMGAPPAN